MSEKRTLQDQDKYVLRFPEGMRDRLKEAAAAARRSMNAEIVARLERTFNLDAAIAEDEARFRSGGMDHVFDPDLLKEYQRQPSDFEREYAAETSKVLRRLLEKHGLRIEDPSSDGDEK